jgi:endonuclease/exonuclease/phosphatase family metal-dependent hydrolase
MGSWVCTILWRSDIEDGNRGMLRAATYNIHQAVGRDGRRDPQRVAHVIQSLDADLIALQEVDAAPGLDTVSIQMTEMAAAGHYLAIPGPTITRSERSYGNALLTRLEVERVERFDLTQAGREPRGAIDACLRSPGGEPLRCVATHLGLSARERRRQLEMLLRLLAEKWGQPLVLMGDFNAWAPFSRIERALSRLMAPSPRPRSFPSSFPLLALDRIWVHPGRLLVDLRAHDTPLTRDASDHLPVVVKIRNPAVG